MSLFFHPVVGGTETIVLNLARRMVTFGHTVNVYTSLSTPNQPNFRGRLSKREQFEGLNVYRSREFLPMLFNHSFHGEDVVHLHSFGPLYFYVESFRNKNRKLVSTLHGEEIVSHGKLRNRLFGSKILDRSSRIIAQTDIEKAFIMDYYKIDGNKIAIIPPGVDDSCFKTAEKPSPDFVSRMQYGSGYILSLCRVVPQKRLEVAINAMKYLPSEIHYIIAGIIQDRPTYNACMSLAAKLGIEKRIHFIGFVNEELKKRLILNSEALIVPGDETFSIASVEAMCQGVPIVAANHLVLPSVIRDGVNGLLFDYMNSTSASNKLNYLLQNKAAAKSMGLRGRQMAWENWRWDVVAKQTEKLYLQLF